MPKKIFILEISERDSFHAKSCQRLDTNLERKRPFFVPIWVMFLLYMKSLVRMDVNMSKSLRDLFHVRVYMELRACTHDQD